ncbi:hypothetical protein WR25_05453 [Diploscapter pachys]|uniref:Uncharacterized protein n=1 Tax=Diploscapter pachys TaxID=2018661 RepID=A0A2A2M4U4_9BILA|nr:hypothetical protein WR25_05453 [Diploscapter pachys]
MHLHQHLARAWLGRGMAGNLQDLGAAWPGDVDGAHLAGDDVTHEDLCHSEERPCRPVASQGMQAGLPGRAAILRRTFADFLQPAVAALNQE